MLLEDDNSKVRKILTTLNLAEYMDRFTSDAPRGWRLHRLSGGCQCAWSVSVSGNLRITFMEAEGYIDRLNLEAYH